MKRYLITGAMALLAGFYLTSCTHDDVGYDNLYEEKTQTFEKAFKNLYGQIDPKHDWGFTPIDVNFDSNISASQAATRGINANANEWADPTKQYGGWIVPDPLTDAQKDKVRRYFQTHPNPDGVTFSYKDFFVQQVYKGGTNLVGSQSPEVYYAASGQKINSSKQMDHLTCGSYGEGAETRYYYDHIEKFNEGDATELDVLNNGQYVGGTSHRDKIALMVDSKSDCFGYWNSNGSIGHNDMYIIVAGSEIQKWENTKTADWNGETQNADVSGMWFVGFDFEQLVGNDVYTNNFYEYNGKQYHYLIAETNQYCGDLKHIDPEPQGDEVGKLLKDGYLPVNNSANKDWVKPQGCADGYYSDWIVRVIPGVKKDTSNDQQEEHETHITSNKYTAKRHLIIDKGRIFVEDLYNATRADIDYNDAVYDAIIWYDYDVEVDRSLGKDSIQTIEDGEKKFRVEMALLAAGGTIPLKIAGDKFGDVHQAFGVGLTTIVNTVGEASNVFGSLVTGQPYVHRSFDYTNEIYAIMEAKKEAHPDDPVTITINDIPVDVLWVTGDISYAARLNNKQTYTYQKDDQGKLVIENGEPLKVSSNDPVVPHLICVPIGTRWPQERVNIGLEDEGPYHLFPNYVADEDGYKNRVWKENVDEYLLYPDNRSPLAYSDKSKGFAYLTDKKASVEGTILWPTSYTTPSSPQDLGNWNNRIEIKPDNLFENNININQCIRLYGNVSDTNDWMVQLYGGMWGNNGTFDNDGKLGEYSNSTNSDVATKGYIEIPLTEYIVTMLTQYHSWGVACIIQGKNFTLTHITVVPKS